MISVWRAFFLLLVSTFRTIVIVLVGTYFVFIHVMALIAGSWWESFNENEVSLEDDNRQTFSFDKYIFKDTCVSDSIQVLNNSPEDGPTSKNFLLNPDLVKDIELQLTKYERVSIAFLFFDSNEKSLEYCRRSLSQYDYPGLRRYAKEHKPETWSMKLLECLCHVQNFFLLETYGLEKLVALEVFNETSYILPERLFLYKVCESLTQDEANRLMNSISDLPNEEYLELFFLKLSQPEEWNAVIEYLKLTRNPCVSQQNLDILIEALKLPMERYFSPQRLAGPNFSSDLIDIYPVRDPNHVGLSIIINQHSFSDKNFPLRLGSEKDVADLEEVLKSYTFEVLSCKNSPLSFFGHPCCYDPSSVDAIPLMKLIDQNFKKNFSFFFIIIMSHGSEGTFITSDCQPVPIKYLLQLLNTRKCLKNIPKVIIIQACQGDKFLQSSSIAVDGFEVAVDAPLTRNQINITPQLQSQIGEYISDAFIVMSTVEGFKSFRNECKGSHFIQYLCECLRKYPNDSLYDIVTEVIRLVYSETVVGLFAQQPVLQSLLRKKLYLKPFRKDKD